MSAIAHRRFGIVLFAVAQLLVPVDAQETKKKAEANEPPLEQTADGTALQAALLMTGANEPYAVLGTRLLATEHPLMDAWGFPIGIDFWLTDTGVEIRAAVHVVGACNRLGALGARMLASDEDLGPTAAWKFVFDEMSPLNAENLDRVQDELMLPKVDGVPLNELHEADRAWYILFNEALGRSHRADLDMFKKSARFPHVHYPHLKAVPRQHRGKILTVKGKLILIREVGTPRLVRDEAPDLTQIYTGYIIGPTKGSPPFAIAFTSLPEGIKPSENLDLEVTFHGYFLSMVKFPPERGAKGQKDVISPYLVGKTLILHPPGEKKKEEEKTSYAYPIIVSTVGGLVFIAFLVAMLNVWFRRGDQRVQAQLTAVREKTHKFDLEPADAVPETPVDSPIPTAETGIKPADANGDVKPPASQ